MHYNYIYMYVNFYYFVAPSSPVNITISRNSSNSFVINWLPPMHPNGEIKKYQFIFYPTNTNIQNRTLFDLPPTTLEKQFPDLVFYTQYSFQIRAVNEFYGEWSPVMKRFTDPNG